MGLPAVEDWRRESRAAWNVVWRHTQRAVLARNPPANADRHKIHRFNPCCEQIPWERAQKPILVFLPRGSHEQRSLAGYVRPISSHSQTQLKRLSRHAWKRTKNVQLCCENAILSKGEQQKGSEMFEERVLAATHLTGNKDLVFVRFNKSLNRFSFIYVFILYWSRVS